LTTILISPIKKIYLIFKSYANSFEGLLNPLSIPILIIGLLSFTIHVGIAKAQTRTETKRVINAVAGAVLKNASFKFIDQKSGTKYSSLSEAPFDTLLKPESPYNDWRYWNGVLNIAMLNIGKTLHDSSYTNFVTKNISFSFDNYSFFQKKYTGQDKWNYPFTQLFKMEELDDYGAMGGSLIETKQFNSQERCKAYLAKAADYIRTKQNRMEDGTLVRTFPHKWTLWADDLYMSVSFLSRLGRYTCDSIYFNDAANQVINFHKYLFDQEKGIMYHCWYSGTRKNGIAFWGRANGWALLAQIDLLERLPKNHPLRNQLLTLFNKHIEGIVKYQDSTGLWHQLLDKPDSYLETSCSAMFTYAIAKAADLKFLNRSYTLIAKRGWKGIMTKIKPDGEIEGVCTGTGVGDDLNFYYNRPAPLNDVHGIGAVLLAGTEMLNIIP
jgi:rhamnogalacturonyl hydrolase YesR